MNSQSRESKETSKKAAPPDRHNDEFASALELSLWIDLELENLESQFTEFVTKRSTVLSIGRSA